MLLLNFELLFYVDTILGENVCPHFFTTALFIPSSITTLTMTIMMCRLDVYVYSIPWRQSF